jgi:hypothetical protein
MSQLHSAGLSSAAEGVPSRSAGGLYCAYVHDVCWAPRPAGANFGQYTADARCLQMRLCLFLDARLFLAQRVRREPCSAIRMKATRVLSSVWFHLRSRYYTGTEISHYGCCHFDMPSLVFVAWVPWHATSYNSISSASKPTCNYIITVRAVRQPCCYSVSLHSPASL